MPRYATIALLVTLLAPLASALDEGGAGRSLLPISTRQKAGESRAEGKPALRTEASRDVEAPVPSPPALEALPPSRFQQFLGSIGYRDVPYYGIDFFRNSSSSASHRPVPADYLVGPGDELILRMWGKVDVREVLIVDPEGRVDLPYAGPVTVAGKRLVEARAAVSDAMARVFADFKLDLAVTRLRTIQVVLTGEVVRPGVYRVGAGTDVLHALAFAGGVLPSASIRSIRHLRKGQAVASIDSYDILLRGAHYPVSELLDGDTIFVPAARMQVALVGGVRRPAIYEVASENSLDALLELAGGLDFTAACKSVVLYRMDENGRLKSSEISVTGAGFTPAHGDLIAVMEPPAAAPGVVSIKGEVVRPGFYPYRDGMRLADLVGAAGGTRPGAYPRGAVFTRESVRALQQQRLDEATRDLEMRFAAQSPELGSPDVQYQTQYVQQLMEKLRTLKAQGRVTVDLAAALADPASLSNIPLEPLDTLYIPFIPSTVTVVGALYSQAGIVHREGMTVADALASAGGLPENADVRSLYVMRADGSVLSTASLRAGGYAWDSASRRWRPRSVNDATLFPGDTVVVPVKLERRIYPLAFAKDITQILYNIAVSTGVVVGVF